jgi:hypothetical protein
MPGGIIYLLYEQPASFDFRQQMFPAGWGRLEVQRGGSCIAVLGDLNVDSAWASTWWH